MYTLIKNYLTENNVEAVVGKDVIIKDNLDGKGPYIDTWNLDIKQPSFTKKQINGSSSKEKILSANKSAGIDIICKIKSKNYAFQTDIKSSIKRLEYIQAMDDKESITWVTEDNKTVKLKKKDLLHIIKKIKEREQEYFNKAIS